MKRANKQENNEGTLFFKVTILSFAAVCLFLGVSRAEAQEAAESESARSSVVSGKSLEKSLINKGGKSVLSEEGVFMPGMEFEVINYADLAFSTNESASGAAQKPCYDFFGTGRTSFSIINSENNVLVWRHYANPTGAYMFFNWGLNNAPDRIAPGYYDNDNRADANVWRPSVGTYYLRPSTSTIPNTIVPIQWGLSSDFARFEADYDGDGRDDPTVIRRSGGQWQWLILRSSNSTLLVTNFGIGNATASEDIPFAGADYTGDGRADITVLRQNAAGPETYLVGDAVTGNLVLAQTWGEFSTDYYIIGDYLGDSRADFAVWRGFGAGTNGVWYIRENGGPGQVTTQFGIPGDDTVSDTPICGDYDGNGKDDIAVYRSSNKSFYWLTNPANQASLGGFVFQTPPNTAPITNEIPVARFNKVQ
jgi:hypothetical protein